MNEYLIHGTHKKISELLGKKQLKYALEELSNYVKEAPEWNLHTDLEDIKTAYQYMLKYFNQNINDPHRANLYNDLIKKAYILNDRILLSLDSITSNEYYYTCLKEQKDNPNGIAEYKDILEDLTEEIAVAKLLNTDGGQDEKINEIHLKHYTTNKELISQKTTSHLLDTATFQAAYKLIHSEMIAINDLALFVSAVTLGALHVFDIRKYLLLMEAYRHPYPLVYQRALIGIILLSLDNSERLECESDVLAYFDLYNSNEEFRKNMTYVQIQLLRTRETKKVDKKIREDIMPNFMKETNFMRNMGLEELGDDLTSNDLNPDWGEFYNSKLQDKLKEIGDMQSEGIDVYMSSFSQLKGFPFFREITNWFYPFDPNHPSLKLEKLDDKKFETFIQGILYSNTFCESDKYSISFLVSQLQKTQQKHYIETISEQFRQEVESGHLIPDPDYIKADTISRQYIYDLYRFFKLYPRRHEFDDMFDHSLNLLYCPILKNSINELEQQIPITEYLFTKGYYPEAVVQLEQLIQKGENDAEVYQKLGFCYQKNKNYQKAIDAYIQADVRRPDNVWTNRHLAQCYRALQNLEEAVVYYKKVEEVQPENLNLLLSIGQCFAELKQYEEAFSRFFKVEYLDPKSLKAQRAIAWCSFVTDKMEQAEKYYDKLLQQDTPLPIDFLNAGHVAWSMKNIHKAASLYTQGCNAQKNAEEFIEMILKDEEELLLHGISKDDLPLMLDLIRYNISSQENKE